MNARKSFEGIFEILVAYADKELSIPQAKAQLMDLGMTEQEAEDTLDEVDEED